jgi:hypothetical protein
MPFRKPLSPALILLLVAIATRALALGNPIVHVDEQFYFTVARGWTQGALPYVDIWDRKPIGLFLLYYPAAMLPIGIGIWAYQAMALAAAWGTAMLIMRIAAGHSRDTGYGPLLAGVCYLGWIILAEGQGGQTPIFYNLLTACAAALLIRPDDGPHPPLGAQVAAMLAMGVAIQINTIILFEGMFFGLWALWRQWQSGRGPLALAAIGILLATSGALPTLAAMGSYAAIGHFGDWWYANIVSIGQRHTDPMREKLGNLAGLIAILAPLVAMAVIGLLMRDRWQRGAYAFMVGWLGVSIGTTILFGTWFDHYGLRVMLPAAIAASVAIGAHHDIRRWAPWVIGLMLIGGQVLLAEKLWRRGTPAQFARLVASVGHGPGCLYIYDGDPMLYAYARRCTVTHYLFPSHLTRARETGAIGVDQRAELTHILAQKPATIVVSPPFRGERTDLRAQLNASLHASYRLRAAVDEGNHKTDIYQLID